MGKIGTWTEIDGLKMNETESKFQKRHNLHGLTFLSAITVIKFKYAMTVDILNIT